MGFHIHCAMETLREGGRPNASILSSSSCKRARLWVIALIYVGIDGTERELQTRQISSLKRLAMLE